MFFSTNYRPLKVPCTVDHHHHHFLSNSQLSFTLLKKKPSIISKRLHSAAVSMQFSLNVRDSAPLQLQYHIIEKAEEEEETQITLEYLQNLGLQMNKEAERRRKIGLAKKGKVPWNKGRKHTAETRALITNRTREALKDPKVRKRMCERQTHACSTETREKMVMGQKRAWQKRYKVISNRNKFYSSWGDCIAESAKKGLLDQQILDWDSYEKMTSEIAFQQLHLAEEKGNAKKMAKLTRGGEKREIRAIQRKEKEEKARCRREEKIKLRLDAKKAKEELQVSRKLKAKITKIRRRKTLNGHHRTKLEEVATNHEPAIEKLDLELIQREKSRRDLSLADQIQAAKQRRSVNGEHATMTHEVDLDMLTKRQKPQSLLSFADQILAAKNKRAESAMKEALNGQVVGEDVATTSLQQSSTDKPNFELMRVEKVQSMSSFADQIQAAKQKQAAEAATKASVINGFKLRTMEDVATSSPQPSSIKGQDLDSMRREKARGMLSFADQIQAAKQKRAEESAAKENLALHPPIS